MKKFLLFIAIFSCLSFVSNRVEKLIRKEITSIFEIEDYSIENIKVSEETNNELPAKISENNLMKILHNNEIVGYYYTGQGFGKVDYYDYLVIFNKDLIISKIKILVYREEHGGEIGSKRWLKQFIGKHKQLKYEKDIAGISGATISAKSLTLEVNKVLKTITILKSKNSI